MLTKGNRISIWKKEDLVSRDGNLYGYNCQISAQWYDKQAGESKTRFSGYVRMVGDAKRYLDDKEPGDRKPIHAVVENFSVESYRVGNPDEGEKPQTRYSFTIFELTPYIPKGERQEVVNMEHTTPEDNLPF